MTDLEERVVAALRARPDSTADDLAGELERDPMDVRKALLRLEETGHVGRVPSTRGRGRWVLAPPGPRLGEESRRCRVCGSDFTSIRSPNGRWPKTCGPRCQVEAIERFIAALEKRRERLLEDLEARGQR